MESGGREHPLRADPLQALPDAVRVPRRPRPRPTSPASPSTSRARAHAGSSAHHAAEVRNDLLSSTLAASSQDRRTFEKEALERYRDKPPDDPLLSAVVEKARPPPKPPAGDAYAADKDALLADKVNESREAYDSVHLDSDTFATAGIGSRVDVTLLPAEAEEGAAAGVYIVRSRRNRGPMSAPSGTAGNEGGANANAATSSTSLPPSAPSSASPEYMRVRRSVADFIWLRRRLCARYDGVIVPSLPPMSLAGRLTHGYAYDAERRRGLQRFLRRVVTHPVIAPGDEVLTFLGAASEEAWLKLRREPLPPDGAVADALFGATRPGVGDDGPLRRVGMWGEKFLWQTGKKVNQGLVWLLDRDRGVTDDGHGDDSAKARLERLQTYVRELEASLTSLRGVVARVAKNRASEMQSSCLLQDAIRQLAGREGGKFAAYFEGVLLDVAAVDAGPALGNKSSSAVSGAGVETNAPAANVEKGSNAEVNGEMAERSMEEDSAMEEDSVPVGAGSSAAARALDEVLRDYEERAKGAQGIMAARQEEQEAYERALSMYKRLRDRLESRADSMWEATSPNWSQTGGASGVGAGDSGGAGAGAGGAGGAVAAGSHRHGGDLDNLVTQVNDARERLADVKKHYQAIALRTTDELRRLRTEMHEDVCVALECLAREIVREHALHATTWAGLGDVLTAYRDVNRRGARK